MVSKPNTIEAITARAAPANIAAMPTRAAIRGSAPAAGSTCPSAWPHTSPSPPPIVSSGASVPPEVPLPSEMHHETNFSEHKQAAAPRAKSPESKSVMLL